MTVCMYVCMYVCMCVCMYVRMCVCTYMCMCVYVCLHVCMFLCVYVYVYVFTYVCVCMYICVYFFNMVYCMLHYLQYHSHTKSLVHLLRIVVIFVNEISFTQRLILQMLLS